MKNFTPAEEEEFLRLSRSDDLYERFARSVAPSIFGSLGEEQPLQVQGRDLSILNRKVPQTSRRPSRAFCSEGARKFCQMACDYEETLMSCCSVTLVPPRVSC